MSSSTRPSALQAIIEAYARAKGVTLPAGDLTTIQNIFILIDKTEPSKIVMIPTEILASKQPLALPASKQPLALPASTTISTTSIKTTISTTSTSTKSNTSTTSTIKYWWWNINILCKHIW